MPTASDWQSNGEYTYLDELRLGAFAWEFLRRNSDYQHDHGSVPRGAGANQEWPEPLAQRWGLRFRDRPKSPGG